MPPPFNGGTNAGEILSSDLVGGGADPMAGLGGLSVEEILRYLAESHQQQPTQAPQFLELSPDQIKRHLQPFQDKNAILQKQLEQAQALRQPSNVQHSTGLGAALGGIAGLINTGSSHLQEGNLRAQQKQLQDVQAYDAADLTEARQKLQLGQMKSNQQAQSAQQMEEQKLIAELLRRKSQPQGAAAPGPWQGGYVPPMGM